MTMIRRFVNIVAEKYKSGVYSLHRLDVSKHLFYPSTPQEQVNTGVGDDPPVMERLKELPAPCVRIQPEPLTKTPVTRSMTDLFSLISPLKNEGRIIFVNKIGQTLLIDADANTTRRMPTLKDDKGVMPILISLAPPDAQDQREASPDAQDQREEDLYFMTRRAAGHVPGFRSCFDVLKLGVSGGSGGSGQWLGLPSPPFVDDPQYDEYTPAIIRSHAVVDGGRTICVSFHKGVVGTYCFDTALRAWRHVGDWILPFDGCAEYVPHLKLWLCFSREAPQDLCWTSELSGMPMEQPPELQHFRDSVTPDSVTPENWSPMMSTLVNLGSGRFCITKFFEIKRDTSDEGYNGYFYPVVNTEVAVMSGIEICRGKEGPKVLKHKSLMYQFMDDAIRWVL